MKKIFLALLLIINATAFSQVIVNRAGQANTVQDARLAAQRNFILPRYNDTTAANLDLGIDTAGALIYTRLQNIIYYRQASPKAWVPLTSSANGSNGVCGLQSGGLVTWSGTGLTYDVTSAAYCINSNGYYFGGGQITLDAAPTTNNRFDVLAMDNTGSLVKITGTENVNPQVPSINPATQIYLTAILVTPDGGQGTQSVIWDENTGAPEWAASATGTWTSTNFNSTTTPYHGAIVSEGTGADGLYATGGSGFRYGDAVGLPATNYNSLKFFIKNKQPVPFGSSFTIILVTGDPLGNGNKIPITLTQNFGYNPTSTNWQNITIPLTNFGVFAPGELINNIGIKYFSVNDFIPTFGFLVDYVSLTGGVNNPGTASNYVTNVSRKPGTDSVFQKINGMDYFAHIDSVGGGGGQTLQQTTALGKTTSDTVTVRRLVSNTDLLFNNTARVAIGGNNTLGVGGLNGLVIGTNALASFPAGSQNQNTVIGNNSMASYTNAVNGTQHNIAIGSAVMSLSTNGTNNIVVGNSALRFLNSTNTNSYNTAFGANAASYLDNSAYNAVFGANALGGNSNASGTADTVTHNTVLGNLALYNFKSGRHNTVIGTYSGLGTSKMDSSLVIGVVNFAGSGLTNVRQKFLLGSGSFSFFNGDFEKKQIVINAPTTYVPKANVAFEVKSFDSTSTSIPQPIMTESQRLAIPVGSNLIGSSVYQTDATEGVYIYKSTGWEFAGSNTYVPGNGLVLQGNTFKLQDTLDGPGIKFMWVKDKAAFRAGGVFNQDWDIDSIGAYSAVLGYGKATGYASAVLSGGIASGAQATAISSGMAYGDGSFAVSGGTASNTTAVALGSGSVASNINSAAFSGGNAAGINATAMSVGTASGVNSMAMSEGIASGYSSTALGGASAVGDYSVAMNLSRAAGLGSFASGDRVKSKSHSGVAIGFFNDSTNAASGTSFNLTNRVFQVGNGRVGTDPKGRNAMTILFNGNTGLGSTTNTLAPNERLVIDGNLSLDAAGNKIKIATGTNASIGTATLVAGTVTVATTAIATGSKIFVSVATPGGTQGFISTPTASIINATSFVINSTSATETSTVNWWIIN